MAIPKGYRNNFNTLLRAARNGDLALVECEDKTTLKKVYALCAVGRDGEEFLLSPFAKLFDGDPYKELNPPDPNRPQDFVREEPAPAPKKKAKKAVDSFSQWRTDCPSCKKTGCLTVISAKLARTGERVYPGTQLQADGFEVDPQGKFPNLKDMSTEDEVVHCTECGARFSLTELTLKGR